MKTCRGASMTKNELIDLVEELLREQVKPFVGAVNDRQTRSELTQNILTALNTQVVPINAKIRVDDTNNTAHTLKHHELVIDYDVTTVCGETVQRRMILSPARHVDSFSHVRDVVRHPLPSIYPDA